MLSDNQDFDSGQMLGIVPLPQNDTQDSLLNFARLSEIELMLGPATTTGLLLLLRDEIERRTVSIEGLVHDGEWSAVAIELHDLKGAALNVGAERIGNLAAHFEFACAGSQPPQKFVSRLKAVARETVAAIDARTDGGPSR